MTREEKLALLHSVSIGARPTVMTYDMGLEYEYVTPEGCGSVFGAVGDWPVHRILDVSPEALTQIKAKIQSGSLQKEDLIGTGLYGFYHYIFGVERPDAATPSITDFFKGLLETEPNNDSFFVLSDARSWTPEAFFYPDYEEMASAFIDQYEFDTQKWDDLDDEELDGWINVSAELDGIEYRTFSAKDDEDDE